MRIIQVLTTLSFGDAVGNDTLALKEILKKNGFKTAIYAENIDARLPKGSALSVEKLIDISKDDVIIYHLSTGTKLNYWIKEQCCRKIMIYHNITPPGFIQDYNTQNAELCSRGLEETRMLKDTFDCVYADSEFNKKDLMEMGYHCPIKVIPILIAFDDYKKEPSKKILKRYEDEYTNIVFIGRIAPNKKQEDIIESFYYYNKYYNLKSRLFLVGSYGGMESYYNRLNKYVKLLNVDNVIFTGHIKFDEILAYYHLADVFLCMSEHEGFCVPLVEAMYFNKPIIAYDSCAIKGTLGGSGILLEKKDNLETAGVINKVVNDKELRKRIISNQAIRLKDFGNKVIGELFIDYIKEFLSEN